MLIFANKLGHCMDGWVNVRAGLRIAYSNQKLRFAYFRVRLEQMTLGILRALVLSMFGFGLKMFYFDGCCKNVVGAVIFVSFFRFSFQ